MLGIAPSITLRFRKVDQQARASNTAVLILTKKASLIVYRHLTCAIRLKDARRNSILAALDDGDWDDWHPHLELVEMPKGHVLHEVGQVAQHLYFPVNAIATLLQMTCDGAFTEVGVVGPEGVVGVHAFLGGGKSLALATVQSPGYGYRIHSSIAKEMFTRCPGVRGIMMRYTQALIAQATQTAVCNRHHVLEQQICCWLLTILDRSTGNALALTHELIASVHGVRREGVTQAARRLQDQGCIRYTRGLILVLDRRALEVRACECYGVVRSEYARLLPRHRPARG